MAKMGAKSRSFGRFSEYMVYPAELQHLESMPKPIKLDFLHRNGINDRAVFFAENLITKTREEIEEIKSEIKARLDAAGALAIIELHPSADSTSKSAHIHAWGVITDEVREIVEEVVADFNLSNKTSLEYTSDIFDRKLIRREGDEFVEVKFERNELGQFERVEEPLAPIEEIEEKAAAEIEEEREKFSLIGYLAEVIEELEGFLEDEPAARKTGIEEVDEFDSILNDFEALKYEEEIGEI
jgi:predicted DNA-binding transcriptional regulator